MANQKGGVGKTTSSINLAASDIRQAETTIYECLINDIDIREAIYTTDIKTLDVVPSHIDLVGAEIEMLQMENREKPCRACWNL